MIVEREEGIASGTVGKEQTDSVKTKTEFLKQGKTVKPKICTEKYPAPKGTTASQVGTDDTGSSTVYLSERKLMEMEEKPLLKDGRVKAKQKVIREKRAKVKEPSTLYNYG